MSARKPGPREAVSKAAVDVTTGYGADNFVTNARGDPWGRECFISIVDTATNHVDFRYPAPTKVSVQLHDYGKLPKSIYLLRQEGAVSPASSVTAEEISLPEAALVREYRTFATWAARETGALKGWLSLHFQQRIKKEHLEVMGGQDVSPRVAEYWIRHKRATDSLALRLRIPSDRLRYAFDVIMRSLQYTDLLARDGVYFFPHPIRVPFLRGDPISTFSYPPAWSWGQCLAHLIRTGKLTRKPEEVARVLTELRHRTLKEKATLYHLSGRSERERREIITQIAADCALPSKVKETVRHAVAKRLAIAGIAAGSAGNHPVAVTLEVGALLLHSWPGDLSGPVTRTVKSLRGILEWPGLFRETD